MSGFPLRLLPFILLLPVPAAADGTSAAVVVQRVDAAIRFEDGTPDERTFQRAGIEYWESIGGGMFAGFTIGYAEDDARNASRPFESASGNHGSLGFRFETPLNAYVHLRGRAEYLLQRGERDNEDIELVTRMRQTRAEFGPLLRVQRFEFASGATWRRMDYRETTAQADGEQVRHADADDDAGAFAAIGWRTDASGSITLRYDEGAEDGWTLRFERTYR